MCSPATSLAAERGSRVNMGRAGRNDPVTAIHLSTERNIGDQANTACVVWSGAIAIDPARRANR